MTLWQSLTTLVKEWRKDVVPGTSVNLLLKIIDFNAASLLTSNDPTEKIVTTLETVLEQYGHRVIDDAEEYSSQYATVEDLQESEGIERFLMEISPSY